MDELTDSPPSLRIAKKRTRPSTVPTHKDSSGFKFHVKLAVPQHLYRSFNVVFTDLTSEGYHIYKTSDVILGKRGYLLFGGKEYFDPVGKWNWILDS